MALNLPNNGDSILEYDIDQTNEINKIADQVIEFGTGYRKWESGVFEQWGVQVNEFPDGLDVASMGLFRTGYISILFPTPFLAGPPPRVVVDCRGQEGVQAWQIRNGAPTNLSAGTYALARLQTTTGNVQMRSNWYAIGRWK